MCEYLAFIFIGFWLLIALRDIDKAEARVTALEAELAKLKVPPV